MIERFTTKLPGGRYDHTPLSNFYIEPDDTHVEGEYQAAKTFNLHAKVEILTSKPSRAKNLGKVVDLRPDWEREKFQIMRGLVLVKFLDHPELAKYLLDTGDEFLVEGNDWHDNYWGHCFCKKCESKGGGRNMLGHILMEIRDLIESYN